MRRSISISIVRPNKKAHLIVSTGTGLVSPCVERPKIRRNIAMQIVRDKICAQLFAVKKWYSYCLNKAELADTVEQLEGCHKLVLSLNELSLEQLRGYEGYASAIYFSAFRQEICARSPPIIFLKRVRRPPTDPVNTILSFLYSLLLHECRIAICAAGGSGIPSVLHTGVRTKDLGLALDLMEPFRISVSDKTALRLIGRGQISWTEHIASDPITGACRLMSAGKRILISEFDRTMAMVQQYSYLGNGKSKVADLRATIHLRACELVEQLRKTDFAD